MEALTLIRQTGPRAGEAIKVTAPSVRLGRAPQGNDIPFDPVTEKMVSNFHAEIRQEAGGYVLYDLRSSHGTFVNEQRITQYPLRSGDIIGLGIHMGGPRVQCVMGAPAAYPPHPAPRPQPPPAPAFSHPSPAAFSPQASYGTPAPGQLMEPMEPYPSMPPPAPAVPEVSREELEALRRRARTYIPTMQVETELGVPDVPQQVDALPVDPDPAAAPPARGWKLPWGKSAPPAAPAPAQEPERLSAPKPFVLEEAIKTRLTPEMQWLHDNRWRLRVVMLLVALAWYYQDPLWRLVEGNSSQPVPVLDGQTGDEGLMEPPGSQNQEAVRLAHALQQRADRLPEKTFTDGNRSLRGMRPVLRRAGEDNSFVPMSFVDLVSPKVKEEKSRPDKMVVYGQFVRQSPALIRRLRAAGLTDVYAFIPWLESGYVPSFSDAKTSRAGLWGLTPEVARRHGLTVTSAKDERLDPERATEAAISYLTELVAELRGENYLLAAAAYQEGPMAARALLRNQPTWRQEELTLWHFHRHAYLPTRELEYLTRLLAVGAMCETPEAFGLPPKDVSRSLHE